MTHSHDGMEDAGAVEKYQPDRKGLTAREERELIAEIAISVIRDRSLSSVYGYLLSISGEIPSLEDFFSKGVARKLHGDLARYGIDAFRVPLYSGMGDLLGQLSRLLMVCRDRPVAKKSLVAANEEIGQLDFLSDISDTEYVRHLRNAVMHCRIRIEAKNKWEQSIVWFEDVHPRTNARTALLGFNAGQLNSLIEILLTEVLLKSIKDC